MAAGEDACGRVVSAISGAACGEQRLEGALQEKARRLHEDKMIQ